MNVLIIEDEIANAKRLKKLLESIDSEIVVLETLESIEDSELWFANHPHPDLIFMDIQLTDGLCFEIFDLVKIDSPVIFTTAFDEYAIKAFHLNSIDYLLKPIDESELRNSILKFKSLFKKEISTDNSIDLLLNHLNIKKQHYRSRFLIKFGNAFKTVSVEDIAYFAIDSQLLFVYTIKGERFPMDLTLDELDKMVDPKLFFRINRQFMVSLKAIKTIHSYFNSRLKLEIVPPFENADDVIVSREKVRDFKTWLDG